MSKIISKPIVVDEKGVQRPMYNGEVINACTLTVVYQDINHSNAGTCSLTFEALCNIPERNYIGREGLSYNGSTAVLPSGVDIGKVSKFVSQGDNNPYLSMKVEAYMDVTYEA